ncbi:hypothetical protein F4677DRAFT_21914 [Hypoxylon crocopeplum]|nr:hypothetical protein F4677DRAFT_21914 [Hypoxylon crocopeplum]
MPLLHRPDVEIWKKQIQDPVPIEQLETAPFMWPYINVEDLCKTEPLLLMLNSRARHTPDTFASFDCSSTDFGARTGCIAAATTEEDYYILFDKVRETYGQLVPCGDEDVLVTDPGRRYFSPGDGLWILEIQARIHEFLVKCCVWILHDVSSGMLLGDGLQGKPEPPMLSSSTNAEGIKFLAISSFESQYKAPAEMDLRRLESIVEAKLVSAEDHLWSLRESPGYFVTTLKEWSAHQLELLPDADGMAHPIFLDDKKQVYWGRTIRGLICHAFQEVEFFSGLLDNICCLRDVTDSTTFSIEEGIPHELSKALHELQYYLLRYSNATQQSIKLMARFCSSPPMRPFYLRTVPNPEEHDVIQIMTRSDVPRTKPLNDLVWIIQAILDTDLRFALGSMGPLTEIEFLIQRDPETKHSISYSVADNLSTIGIFCECFQHIMSFQPWVLGFDRYALEYGHLLPIAFQEEYQDLDNLLNVEETQWVKFASHFIQSTGGSFEYPVGVHSGERTVKAMRQSEMYIDSFWELVLRHLYKVRAVPSRVNRVLKRNLQRTPPWVEPPKKAKKGKKKVEKDDDEFDQLLEQIRADNEKAARKMNEPPVSIFKVSKRAFKVLNVLFYDGNDSTQLVDVAWTDLVYAMQALGFTAEKMFGSGWFFQPTKLDSKMGIIFHEPYGGKLKFLMTREMGRRLYGTYNFKREMFVLAK